VPFAIKCNGGPAEGVRVCDRLEDFGLSWPPPDYLTVPGHQGRYCLVSWSKLDAEAAKHPHVGVGAEYEWESTAVIEEVTNG